MISEWILPVAVTVALLLLAFSLILVLVAKPKPPWLKAMERIESEQPEIDADLNTFSPHSRGGEPITPRPSPPPDALGQYGRGFAAPRFRRVDALEADVARLWLRLLALERGQEPLEGGHGGAPVSTERIAPGDTAGKEKS